jgi:predicted HD superfamily hydrolase involved in NAD metabolism
MAMNDKRVVFMKVEEMKEKLEKKLSRKRFEHSINVMETAVRFSKNHDLKFEDVVTAGLLHDCGKEYSFLESIAILEDEGIEIDKLEKENTKLIHAKLGVYVAEKEFSVTNKDVLNAIRYHTTGRKGMSLLEKIIYISDYTEPKRSFLRVDEIRAAAKTDINKAMLMALDDTMSFVIERKMKLHYNTIEAREAILAEINMKAGNE